MTEIKELRKFGIGMSLILTVIGGVLLWKGKPLSFYLFIISIPFFIFGIIFPKVLCPVYKVWMGIASILGWIMTRVILCLVFYLVITPIAIWGKIIGRDVLKEKVSAESYWIKRRS